MNATKRSTILKELRKLILGLSDDAIVYLGMGLAGIAVFPRASSIDDLVRWGHYFAPGSCPDQAMENSLERLGPYQALWFTSFPDRELEGLSSDWKDHVDDALGAQENEVSSSEWEFVDKLIDMGLASRVAELRATVLAEDLESVLDFALIQVEGRSASLRA